MNITWNVYGFQPSQGEKAAQPDIKKYMAELGKARKDLKRKLSILVSVD